MQAILGNINKCVCEFLGRSGQSIIIVCPSNTVYAVESGGHLKSVARVQATFHVSWDQANFHVSWDDDVADALKSHCQLLIAGIE